MTPIRDASESGSRLFAALHRPLRGYLVLAYASVAAALVYVLRFAVNVPYWDDWEFVRLLQLAADGSLTAGDVWSQHNEHRIVLPLLAMFGLAWLTGYNTVAQSVFTVCHLGVLLIYVHAAARRTCQWPKGTAPLWFALAAWVLLGWRQAENLLWGFQIGLTLPLTAAFVSLYHLQAALSGARRSRVHLLAAVAAGCAGSFSTAMGLLIWPGAIVLVIAHWRSGQGRMFGVLWIAAGIVAWMAYLIGYQAPLHHPSLSASLGAPLRLARFFAALNGAWASESSAAVWIGALLLIGFCGVLYTAQRQRAISRYALYVAMALFCLGTLAIVAVGRSPVGHRLAYRSAYATYSQAFVSCMIVLIATAAAVRGRTIQRLSAIAMLAILVGVLNGYRCGLATAIADHAAKQSIAATLVDYVNRPDAELETLYGHATMVRAGAAFLAERCWSVFAHQAASPRRLSPAHYQYGDLLRFGLRGNARPYLGSGWSIDEDGFTWNDGASAFVRMQVGAPPGGLRLEIGHAMILRIDQVLERQRVDVFVDDAPIGTFAAAEPGVAVLDVPAACIRPGVVTLELRFLDVERPGSSEFGSERRRLAVAVSSLRLSPHQ